MVAFSGSPLRPRWIYTDADGTVDYLMSTPQRPWDFGSRGLGGSDTSAAGVPAAFEIRRDYLLHLTLRFPASEWDDVARLVRHLQRAGSATLYPDQDDVSVSHTVYGDAPAIGEEIRPRRSSEPSTLELDISVRRTTSAIFTDPYFGDLLFYWQAGTRVDGMVFTRAGTAYYVDKNGQLAIAAANEERTEWLDLDGDGIFETPVLLLEDARTSLILQSEDLSTTWVNTRSGDTSNAIAAPDGATTADKLIDDSTASSSHFILQNVTKAASELAYAFTVFVHKEEYSELRIQLADAAGSNGVFADVDISAGTITTVSTLGSGWVAALSRITALEDGWYRCEVAGTSDTDTTIRTTIGLNDGTGLSYNGDGASGLYLWGMQLEQAESASSYIKTTTVAVTRSAETMYFDFPFNPRAMTVYEKLVFGGAQKPGGLFHIGASGSGSDPRLQLNYASADGAPTLRFDDGVTNSSVALAAAEVIGGGVDYRVTLSGGGPASLHRSVNKGAEASSSATPHTSLPGLWADTRLYMGSLGAGTRGLNGFLSLKVARGVKTMEEMRVMSS